MYFEDVHLKAGWAAVLDRCLEDVSLVQVALAVGRTVC